MAWLVPVERSAVLLLGSLRQLEGAATWDHPCVACQLGIYRPAGQFFIGSVKIYTYDGHLLRKGTRSRGSPRVITLTDRSQQGGVRMVQGHGDKGQLPPMPLRVSSSPAVENPRDQPPSATAEPGFPPERHTLLLSELQSLYLYNRDTADHLVRGQWTRKWEWTEFTKVLPLYRFMVT